MAARDLVKEYTEECQAMATSRPKATAVGPLAKRPRAPSHPPDDETYINKCMTADELAQGIHLTVSDEACELAKQSGDLEVMSRLSILPGFYYPLKAMWLSRPVWRQEEKVNGDTELLLYYSEGKDPAHDGWYIAPRFVTDTQRLSKKEITFWSKSDGMMPTQGYIPYWSKDVFDGVNFVLQSDMLTSEIIQLQEHIEELEGQLADKAPRAEQVDGRKDTGAGSSGGKQKGDGKDGGDGKSKGKRERAGWMPKTASLIKCVFQEDWNKLRYLAQKFYDEHAHLQKAVDAEGKGKRGKGF